MSDDARAHGPSYRVPRHNGMDPATRRLAIIAAALGGALFVVIGAWSFVGGQGGGPVPVISPPDTPLRVKPANPGGLKIANGLEMFGADAGDSRGDKLAPAPETPDLQGLHPPAPAAPASAASVASALPAPPPMAPAAPAAPTARPDLRASVAAPASSPAPAERPVAASGGRQVQLAALPSRAEAEKEWQMIARHAGRLLDGHSPQFSEAVVNGRTWWRVRTGGFADETTARAFCDQLRTTGAACSVARF